DDGENQDLGAALLGFVDRTAAGHGGHLYEAALYIPHRPKSPAGIPLAEPRLVERERVVPERRGGRDDVRVLGHQRRVAPELGDAARAAGNTPGASPTTTPSERDDERGAARGRVRRNGSRDTGSRSRQDARTRCTAAFRAWPRSPPRDRESHRPRPDPTTTDRRRRAFRATHSRGRAARVRRWRDLRDIARARPRAPACRTVRSRT